MDSPSPAYLILGASGGIGSALARRLVAEGGRVLLAGRSAERLQGLAAELGLDTCVVDATRGDQVEGGFERALALFGRLDGVAHCVGSMILKPAHLTTDAEWARTLDLNLTSAFQVVRAAGRFLASDGGSVVLVSSCAARRGLANHEAIAAAKAGVIGLALSAAATYARQRIRFNCVAPGLVRTPLSEALTRNEANLRYSTSLHPLGRIGEPRDVAAAIRWLLSSDSSWVTGQVLEVDGGLARVQPRAGSG